MDRDIISVDRDGILDRSVHDRIPVITDPTEAEGLLGALIEALSGKGDVQAEFRAGAIWERKGRDDGGDFSPLVSVSPHRDSDGGDEVYLSVSVRIGHADQAGAVQAFVERRRAQSERDRLAELDSEIAERRNSLDTEQSALEDLEARAAALRAATGR